ncbi:hypothetical protein EQG63_00720 [Flavobacterium amnicola]|uniref:IPT/TIG domain-containing protein n=1 Tax=Flavobacterium amnicola TaxID=2506422 RepID=A0A4Q1K3U0_9FLAO|nr:DUF6252 family protein [Flavobacterium amnicola]RXR20486.1 hypothetical protein EQG63_00720 [Flavobacterium amnicola]
MKKIFNIGKCIMVALTLVLSSCSNDDPAPAPAPTPIPANSSVVTAKVNGAAFSSVIFGVSSATAQKMGTGPDTIITVLGSNFSASSISITLHGVTATGTYTLDSTTDSVIAYTPGSGDAAYGTGICSGVSGTVVVTSISDTKIEGTFSFTGKDGENCDTSETKTVTEGSFKGVFQ